MLAQNAPNRAREEAALPRLPATPRSLDPIILDLDSFGATYVRQEGSPYERIRAEPQRTRAQLRRCRLQRPVSRRPPS